MLVGITGKMGSGKSTVAELFERWGAKVIRADEIGWALLDEPAVKQALVKEFGEEILGPDGCIDRKALGRRAFKSPDRLEALNSIVHPGLLAELRRKMESLEDGSEMVVVDAALIAEWGIESWFDRVVVLVCPEPLKVERLTAAGMVREETEERLARQIPDEERIKIADHIIDNSGSLDELIARAREVFDCIFPSRSSDLDTE